MAIAFDIYRLYTQAFGSGVGLPFPGPFGKGSIREGGDFEGMKITPGVVNDPPLKGEFNFQSPQGGSYFLPIKIGTNPTNHWQLPNEPIMSLSGGKMIKETSIRRGKGRGTVTEERGLKDYQITIRGLAINEEENDYPETQIRNIRRICEHEGVVYLRSYITDLYNVQKISIKDFDFPRFPANSIRVQPYVIQAKSDMDFEDFNRIING